MGNGLGARVPSSDPVQESRRKSEGIGQKSELKMARKSGQGVLQGQDQDMGTPGQDGTPVFGSSVMISTSYQKQNGLRAQLNVSL